MDKEQMPDVNSDELSQLSAEIEEARHVFDEDGRLLIELLNRDWTDSAGKLLKRKISETEECVRMILEGK